MLHQIMLNQFSKFIRKLYIFLLKSSYRTRTTASGLYIIGRLYFEELGIYDEGIKVWGEENL